MSTTTTFDMHSATIADAAPAKKTGFFDRLIAARMRQGKSHVAHFLAMKSDADLAALGFNAEQIAAIRKTGEIPLSFWR